MAYIDALTISLNNTLSILLNYFNELVYHIRTVVIRNKIFLKNYYFMIISLSVYILLCIIIYYFNFTFHFQFKGSVQLMAKNKNVKNL